MRRLILAAVLAALAAAPAQAGQRKPQEAHVVVDRTIICHDPRAVGAVNDPGFRQEVGDVNYFAATTQGGCKEIGRDEVFVIMGGMSESERQAVTNKGLAIGFYYIVGGPPWYVLLSAIEIDGDWTPPK
jgi:hypothetical protein